MSANVSNYWEWTKRREEAALLVAEDRLSDTEIAKSVGITQRTLERWKRVPEFRARVREHIEAAREAIKAKGVADRRNRVEALNERWLRLQRIIEARSVDLKDEVPGGETGLLVRVPMLLKVQGYLDEETGRFFPTGNSELVYKYELDASLLKELREHEKQAAQELGEWTESKADGILKYIDLTKLTNEQLERLANGDDPVKVILGHRT